jgi:hypothetical protein
MTVVNVSPPIFCSDSLCTSINCVGESCRSPPPAPPLFNDTVGHAIGASEDDAGVAGSRRGTSEGGGGDGGGEGIVGCGNIGGGAAGKPLEIEFRNGDGPELPGISDDKDGVRTDMSGDEEDPVTSLPAVDGVGGTIIITPSLGRA